MDKVQNKPDSSVQHTPLSESFKVYLVRSYPVLYDLSQPKYMDSSFKTDIWNTIGKEIKADVITVL
jgi:hypothetical protein